MELETKLKACAVARIYQSIARGETWQYKPAKHNWRDLNDLFTGPDMSSDLNKYRKKPEKKIIDLSVLLESGIDCQFWDYNSNRKIVSKLKEIKKRKTDNDFFYIDESGIHWRHCQPRLNYWHSWGGGDDPLPDGIVLNSTLRNGEESRNLLPASRHYWGHDMCGSDIIRFYCTGEVMEGYCWPWEVDQ